MTEENFNAFAALQNYFAAFNKGEPKIHSRVKTFCDASCLILFI